MTSNAVIEGARYASAALVLAVALHFFSPLLAAPWWGLACGILATRIIVKVAGPELYKHQIRIVKFFDQIRDPVTAGALVITTKLMTVKRIKMIRPTI